MTINTFEILIFAAGLSWGLIVLLWPVLLLQPLRGRHPFDANLYLRNWLLLAVLWFAGSALPSSAKVGLGITLIPEPFNVLAFLACGALIGAFASLARLRPGQRATPVGERSRGRRTARSLR